MPQIEPSPLPQPRSTHSPLSIPWQRHASSCPSQKSRSHSWILFLSHMPHPICVLDSSFGSTFNVHAESDHSSHLHHYRSGLGHCHLLPGLLQQPPWAPVSALTLYSLFSTQQPGWSFKNLSEIETFPFSKSCSGSSPPRVTGRSCYNGLPVGLPDKIQDAL